MWPTVEVTPEPDWPYPWMPTFLQALSAMPNISAAAQVSGISRQYAHRVMKEIPQFKTAADEAMERAWDLMDRYGWQLGTNGVEQTVTKTRVKTVGGKEVERVTTTETGRLISPQMTALYLRSRWPERFGRDVHVEHTGPEGGPIRHEIHRPLEPERALELARIALELESGDVVDAEVVDEEDES